MAAHQPQEKEWVPRSHIAGSAFGTLTRAAGSKAKLFMQLAEEEADENAAYKGRPDIGGSYTEVAFVTCKDELDGKKYAGLVKTLFGRTEGDAFHAIYCIEKGSGVNFSKYLSISVGSSQAYVDSYRSRTEDETAELVRLVKRYDSTIYISKAADEMKDIVKTLNARKQSDRSVVSLDGGTTRSAKPVSIDIAESPNYRFETGQNLVSSFLKATGANLNVRVERIETEDAASMQLVEKGLLALYSSGHRISSSHPWRPSHRKSIGYSSLLNTPLAFILKMDETHTEVVIFDLCDNFEQDSTARESPDIASAVGAIKEISIFTNNPTGDKKLSFVDGKCGPVGHPESTYTQTHHAFGNAALFNVFPATEVFKFTN